MSTTSTTPPDCVTIGTVTIDIQNPQAAGPLLVGSTARIDIFVADNMETC